MSPLTPIVLDAHNPGPMTGAGNHTYLLMEGTNAAVLVDAGVGETIHLASLDRELNARRGFLACVVATHGHSDHVAGARLVARRHPAAIFAKFPWPEEDSRSDVVWQTLADGEAVPVGNENLMVLHTPGHSPDHIVLWHEETRVAFTGDLVIDGGSVMIHWNKGGSLIQYLASLERLIELRPARLFPAHGPVISDPIAVLTAYIEHRHMRETQVIQALQNGWRSVAAIAESIYDGLDPGRLGAASQNVRAHLEKLRVEGRAVLEHDQWSLTIQ
jgi:glyoxylase-like metal-dependent hydrolase (beta-lactamase superfamily II)